MSLPGEDVVVAEDLLARLELNGLADDREAVVGLGEDPLVAAADPNVIDPTPLGRVEQHVGPDLTLGDDVPRGEVWRQSTESTQRGIASRSWPSSIARMLTGRASSTGHLTGVAANNSSSILNIRLRLRRDGDQRHTPVAARIGATLESNWSK